MNVKKRTFCGAGIGYEDRDNFSAALNRMELVVAESIDAWLGSKTRQQRYVVVVETFMF